MNVEVRLSVVEKDIDGSCRMINLRDKQAYALFLRNGKQFPSEFVLSDGTHRPAFNIVA